MNARAAAPARLAKARAAGDAGRRRISSASATRIAPPSSIGMGRRLVSARPTERKAVSAISGRNPRSRSRTLQAGDVDCRGQGVRAAGGSDRAGDISHGCYGSLPRALHPQKHGFPYAHRPGSGVHGSKFRGGRWFGRPGCVRKGGRQRKVSRIPHNVEADVKVRVAFQDGAEIFKAGDGYAVGRGDPIAWLETDNLGRAPGLDGAGDWS